MKRLKPEDAKIWGMVVSTIHPLPGRATPTPSQVAAKDETPARVPPKPTAAAKVPKRERLDRIEPNRRHLIARGRQELSGRLDLHGLDQVRAQAVLESFITRAWADGARAVLVITGKGVQGDGVLRRRVPEWLAAPHLTPIVAGVSHAAKHHGGEGALYVALKRRTKA